MGMASVSRSSCERILSSGPGRSIVIVIGGAAESLYARPGTADLTLKRRLGFIRLAIKQNASLVPVFSFGENELFEQMDNSKGSTVWKIQKKMQAMLGYTLPLFHARGVFNCKLYCPAFTGLFSKAIKHIVDDMGLVPFRHPIVTVGKLKDIFFLSCFVCYM